MARAPLHLVLGLAALAGCSGESADDPAVATPGAGIPMGAVGAVGASLQTRPDPSAAKEEKAPTPRGVVPVPTPEPEPSLDPFAEPDPPPAAPAPKGHPPAKGHPSPTETTL